MLRNRIMAWIETILNERTTSYIPQLHASKNFCKSFTKTAEGPSVFVLMSIFIKESISLWSDDPRTKVPQMSNDIP